jgi:transketolase
MLLRIPNLRVIEPGCNDEMAQALRCAVETPGPFYLRIVRCEVGANDVGDGYRFQLGKGVTVVDDGVDAGIICTGYMLRTAKAAATALKGKGIRVRVDHHPSLKPFDRERVCDLASRVPVLVTAENHCRSGGLYSLVAETLVGVGSGVRVAAIGTDPDDFIHTGHVNDLLHHYEMTSAHLVRTVEALLAA